VKIMNVVEFGLSKTEEYLSKSAVVPVVGVIPATMKVALGILQTTAASTCFATGFLVAMLTRNPSWVSRPIEHTMHGIANIIAGLLEGIPPLGTLMHISSARKVARLKKLPIYVSKGNDYKRYNYKSLKNAEIRGSNASLVGKAKTLLSERVARDGDPTAVKDIYLVQEIVTIVLANQRIEQRLHATSADKQIGPAV